MVLYEQKVDHLVSIRSTEHGRITLDHNHTMYSGDVQRQHQSAILR